MKILDAGCGAGLASQALFGDKLRGHDFLGIDISDAVEEASQRFTELNLPGEFRQLDLMDIPADLGPFDIIFSEGVLHHTDSVRAAIFALSNRLSHKGRLMFYVYKKKAPLREFSDDLIRNHLSGMSHDEAWDELLPLTRLGEALGKLDVSVEIPEAIPYLGIEAGTHNVQRLLYYTVLKSWYHEGYSIQEMNHVNFDWFRPLNCHRHSIEEIREYVHEAGLVLERLHDGPSGFTVIARRS